ncbi:peroxidase family protein [Nocardioides donggukensis]|uniref:Heme peroxidase n=1 Tax=Nocardioides donggukensis TaxID=2774019 RepID=A0A927K6B0_9ACTN|nr:heme peroxidase family protein [Nocardioides donggukensis]MBD8869930.1 heme peroxidase [Nocardioides donggukensis]
MPDQEPQRHRREEFVIEGEDSAARTTPPPFRFSRLGPRGRRLPEAIRTKVGRAMTDATGRGGGPPAGYTYLGQFVDHDLTFDATTVALGEAVSPADLLQGRSPTLDLDSLYGAGPADPVSALFYASDGRHLRTGRTVATPPDPAMSGFDLPRRGTGSAAARRRAVIPDLRNDENLAVAQHHAAMIRFHNRVLDTLPASTPQAARFRRARRRVVLHYQWMLRTDYLSRICDRAVVDDVFTNGRKVFEVGADPFSMPTMPVEFSVGAFRFGHSMVRASYDWNARFPGRSGSLDFLFTFSGTSGDLGGNRRLPSNWIADWRRMYRLDQAGRADLKPPTGAFNPARRIDTGLVDPLAVLPPGSFGGPGSDAFTIRANLAFRNLTRASMVRLPSGQQTADLLSASGVSSTRLTRRQIRVGSGDGASLTALTPTQLELFLDHTPLWFYVLREAELNGGRLTGVGARVVAETFHRAMEGSRHSIVRNPGWRPSLGAVDGRFTMPDLLLFAFEGRKDLLAPLT